MPCVCSSCRDSKSPYLFSQKRLLQRKQNNKLTIECDNSYADVSVLELLDGLKLEQLPKWAEDSRQESSAEVSTANINEPERIIKIFLASKYFYFERTLLNLI